MISTMLILSDSQIELNSWVNPPAFVNVPSHSNHDLIGMTKSETSVVSFFDGENEITWDIDLKSKSNSFIISSLKTSKISVLFNNSNASSFDVASTKFKAPFELDLL